MSGPSLKKQDAHTLIHESALNEAKELRMLLQKCLEDDHKEKALKVAEVTIEHWESRTLVHANSEEEGLYKEMVDEKPYLKPLVIQLTRDHDLMRRIVEQMRILLINDEIDERMISLLDSLIIVDSIHNDDEMNKLLGESKCYSLENLEKGNEIAWRKIDRYAAPVLYKKMVEAFSNFHIHPYDVQATFSKVKDKFEVSLKFSADFFPFISHQFSIEQVEDPDEEVQRKVNPY